MVLDAHHFLRDVLFNEVSVGPEPYWHRPIVVADMATRLGDVIGLMKLKPEHAEDDVIDHDLILVWGKQKRIITGPISWGGSCVESPRGKSDRVEISRA